MLDLKVPHAVAAAGVRIRLARLARGAALALALAMLVTGCKSYYPVDIHTADGLAVLSPGELVRVTTKGGEKREFEITQVDHDRVAGHLARYTSTEISTLERHELDVPASIATGTGVYILVAVVAAAVLASHAGAAIF